jgi:hypothetical protein
MVSFARLKAALEMRDVGLAVLKKVGKPEPGMGNDVTATRGVLMLSVHTPFSEQGPGPSEYHKYLGATIGLVPPKNLPYGLDIWAPKKVLNIEWNDHGHVVLVRFKPGAWQWELRRWLDAG